MVIGVRAQVALQVWVARVAGKTTATKRKTKNRRLEKRKGNQTRRMTSSLANPCCSVANRLRMPTDKVGNIEVTWRFTLSEPLRILLLGNWYKCSYTST